MNRMCSEPRRGGRTRRPVRPGTARSAAAVLLGVLVAGCGAGTAVTAAPPAPTAAITASPSPTAEVPTATAAATGSSGPASVAPVASPAPGNGPAGDRAAVETVFRTYLRAVADGDFATACSLNAPETNQRLLDELARRGTPAATCEQAIAALYAGSGVAQGAATIANTLSIERVDVDGDAATVAWSVEVSGRRPVVTNALRRVDGQWRLLPTPDPAG
jgi:predicted lipid-binding transport protein (Tim44 family)